MARSDGAKPFRVIICGGGIVGLTLSHALQLANIDHVVLEKYPKIVSLHGAALSIFPSTQRIFDQFGVLDKILKTVTPVSREYQRWPDGTVNVSGTTIGDCGRKFGTPVIIFDRERCVSVLYENLPDKSKVRTNARVERIEHTQSGVKVHLADGTIEEGDMVIGADGVHSIIRELMWEYAAQNEPDAIPQSDKECMSTQYKAIFGVSDFVGPISSLGPSDVHVIYGQDNTKLLFTQPGKAMWAIMWKDEYIQPPQRWKPTKEEESEIVERMKDIKFTEAVTFGDLWKARNRGGLLNVEEGVLNKWHAGRIVLVGDSAHKMSADLGIGANMAMESAVVLCNLLHRALQNDPNRHPSQSELSALFTEYQSLRHERVATYKQLSGDVLRMRSWSTAWKKFFITRIAVLPPFERFQAGKMLQGLAKAPKLDYVPVRTIDEEAEGWKLAQGKQGGEGVKWVCYALITTALGVAVSYGAAMNWGSLLRSQ